MTPVTMETRWELFVDEALIDFSENICLKLHRPERRDPAMVFDAPWEDMYAWPMSLLQEDDRVRLYYRAAMTDVKAETEQCAVAQSDDGGRTFTRPDIGQVEFEGSKANNLLADGIVAFRDTNPACPDDQRYKGFQAAWKSLRVCVSGDGVTWRPLLDDPLDLPGTFDSVNTAFWDTTTGCYRSYTRWIENLEGPPEGRVRSIQVSTSDDFIHWAPPQPLDFEDGESVELYTNAIRPCPGAEHIYVGFPNRFISTRQISETTAPGLGMNDALFMTSRDGLHWRRHLDAWVRPGLDECNWTTRNNYPVWGLVQSSPTEWNMYITSHYAQPDRPVRIDRLSIRPMGFVSAHATWTAGELLTVPLTFTGQELQINASTSAAGSIRVQVEDLQGNILEGLSFDDMSPMFGDRLQWPVPWTNPKPIQKLRNTPVRVRFELRDADLFGFRFA